MSSNSSYRNGSHSRSFYPSLASISSSDSGQLYGSSRDMAPPPLEFPPRPVEIDIDLSSSRTLPSPSASGSNTWDPILQPHGFGDGPYGSSNMSKIHGLSVDCQPRGPTQDPLYQWYEGNDGPWIPKVIPEIASEEKVHARQIGNRNTISYGNQYRQPNPSDAGSVQFGVSHSDSGYGTRRSVGNTSVFSADVTERDQDCQSLAGHVENFQPFNGFNDSVQQRDSRNNESWTPAPTSTASNPPSLVCPTCHKLVKTQSELKKHDLRHRKPFKCTVAGCLRIEGFSTTNDLDRHTKSKHPATFSESVPTKMYRCHVTGCKSKEKTWPRLDNFRSHLQRVHNQQLLTDEDFDDMIRRAEFWEKATLDVDQDNLFSQQPFQNLPRAAGPSANDNFANFRRAEPEWKGFYPDILTPTEPPAMAPVASIAPILPKLDKFETKRVPPDDRVPLPEPSHPSTVQPLDVFQPPTGVGGNMCPLERVLAPAGNTDSAILINDDPSPKPKRDSKSQGKATRQNEASAAEEALTKVIRNALSGAISTDLSNDRTHTQDMKRNSLPNGRSASRNSWHSSPHEAHLPTNGTISHINLVDSPSPDREIHESQVQKVVKTILDAGYKFQTERSTSPKIQNLGSAASNKSDNQVTCQVCKKFKGRPCELKKHMKRHERPYGCTFLTCNKTFGSKNDWKRHENSQHFQLETWRCDEERPEGGGCAKVCYRKQTFQEHLGKEHHISDEEAVKNKLEACRIGRNCQARFWCGFCTKLVELKKKGMDAWTERFDHIDDHFMGRHNFLKQGIQDWIPVDSDKPKGDVNLDAPAGKDGHISGPDVSGSGSLIGVSSASAGAAGGSPADAIILGDGPRSPKRKHSSGDDNSRPQKQHKTATNVETTIYCCQCRVGHNPKFNQSCTSCDNAHTFCQYCVRESRRHETE